MLRFACRPTRDMDVNDLRVALLNFIVAQQRKEDLIVRIEDTEQREVIEGKDKEILDLLDLFGIQYSQTLYQSQNFRFHSAMALQLLHEKKAFSCFCSPEWIQKKIDEAEAAKKPYLYDDACANLPAELVIDNTNPFTVRIKRPTQDVKVTDLIQGELTFKAEMIDSFMILKQDKTPMLDFTCAIDDMLSDISLVIQSQTHKNDAPKQVYVRDALQYDKKVEYAHIPLILSDDASSILSLLKEGYLPEAISNYLISIGYQAPNEIFTIQEALEWFDLTKISQNPVNFDKEKLRAINKAHLKLLDNKELSRYVGFADEEIGALAKLYLDEVATTKELRTKIAPIFTSKEIPQELEGVVKKIAASVKSAPYFENYESFKEYIMQETGLQGDDLVTPLRILLTGAKQGPDLAHVYKYLKNYIGEIVK